MADNTTQNVAPGAPSTINVPAVVNSYSTIQISWSVAADVNNNLAGYVLERIINGEEWVEIYRGALRSYDDYVDAGWDFVGYRVKAFDTDGAYSSYTSSGTKTVTHNTAPIITGTNGHLGTVGATFPAQTYTVRDTEGGTVTVVERLDGVIKRSYTASLGTATSFSFAAAEWQKVTNGRHTISITATDSSGMSSVRTWTFDKAVNSLTFTITPLPADAMPDRCVVDAVGNFAPGSTLKIEVCNNAKDAYPTWEDISDKLGKKHFFSNSSMTSDAWAFGLRCTLTRGSAIDAVWLDYITINYR